MGWGFLPVGSGRSPAETSAATVRPGVQGKSVNMISSHAQLARAARTLQRRILFCHLLPEFSRVATALFFAAGAVVIAARFLRISPGSLWLPGAVAALAGLLYALWRAWRGFYPPLEVCVAELERSNRCGGALVGCWDTRQMRGELALRQPELSYKPGAGVCWSLLAGVVFLAGAFLLPVRAAGGGLLGGFDITRPVAALEQRLETLAETGMLDPEEAESFRERVEEVAEHADSRSPVETWEALDNLSETLDSMQQQAARMASASMQELMAVAELGRELSQKLAAGEIPPEDALFQEYHQLMDMLSQLNAQNVSMQQAAQAMREALADGKVSAQELAEILRELGLSAEEMQRLAQQLAKMGGCEGGQCGDPGQMRAMTRQELADFLRRLAEGGCEGQGGKNGQGGQGCGMAQLSLLLQMAGGGGIGTGAAPPTPMLWNEPLDEEGFKFGQMRLPHTAVGDPQAGELVGLSSAAPEVAAEGGQDANVLTGLQSGGGEARSYHPLPQHRRAVENYLRQRKSDE